MSFLKPLCSIFGIITGISLGSNFYFSYVMRKPVLPYVNNKGADQPAHPHSLISTFVFHCLDSIRHLLAITEITRFQLVSVAGHAGLSLTW